jgi:DNA-binding sugar fermentation-stimulating protein
LQYACTLLRTLLQDRVAMQSLCAFLVQRCDCAAFAPCASKDPAYASAVIKAAAAGVQLVALMCEPKPDGSIHFVREIPVELDWEVQKSTGDEESHQ